VKYQTHLLTSFAGAVGLSHLTEIPIGLAFTAGLIVGTLLPDIDEPNSFISRRTSITITKRKSGKRKRVGLSTLIHMLFGHRGFTHSIAATGILSLLLYVWMHPFVIGLVIGYGFHIVGDFFSKRGVPLLHPLSKKRFKIHLYTTGRWSESVIFAVILIGLLYMGDKTTMQWFMWK